MPGMANGKIRKTIICTREYENGKLVYRKVEVVKSNDRTPAERDTRFTAKGFEREAKEKGEGVMGVSGPSHQGHTG